MKKKFNRFVDCFEEVRGLRLKLQIAGFARVARGKLSKYTVIKFCDVRNGISVNNSPWYLFDFEALSCSTYWRAAVQREAFISKYAELFI